MPALSRNHNTCPGCKGLKTKWAQGMRVKLCFSCYLNLNKKEKEELYGSKT